MGACSAALRAQRQHRRRFGPDGDAAARRGTTGGRSTPVHDVTATVVFRGSASRRAPSSAGGVPRGRGGAGQFGAGYKSEQAFLRGSRGGRRRPGSALLVSEGNDETTCLVLADVRQKYPLPEVADPAVLTVQGLAAFHAAFFADRTPARRPTSLFPRGTLALRRAGEAARSSGPGPPRSMARRRRAGDRPGSSSPHASPPARLRSTGNSWRPGRPRSSFMETGKPRPLLDEGARRGCRLPIRRRRPRRAGPRLLPIPGRAGTSSGPTKRSSTPTSTPSPAPRAPAGGSCASYRGASSGALRPRAPRLLPPHARPRLGAVDGQDARCLAAVEAAARGRGGMRGHRGPPARACA